MIESAYKYSSSYFCEGTGTADCPDCREGQRIATQNHPVLRLMLSTGISVWRCGPCLVNDLVSTPHLVNGTSEGSENLCHYCRNNLAVYCSAECGYSDGDGSHECDYSSSTECSQCDNTAEYCSAECAVSGGSTLTCRYCGSWDKEATYCSTNCAYQDTDKAPECGTCGHALECAYATCPRANPVTLAAASPTTTAVTDDGAITVDGIEFRF